MVIPRAKFPLCSGDLFDSDDFVAADLQIRQSCATILSDVHPPIIVLKSCLSRAATSAQSIKRLMLFPDSPAPPANFHPPNRMIFVLLMFFSLHLAFFAKNQPEGGSLLVKNRV